MADKVIPAVWNKLPPKVFTSQNSVTARLMKNLHFKLTLVEKPSRGFGCHRSLRRRSEVLFQEEDYNNLAADDDENDDQKPDVASEINPVFANKRVSQSTDSNSTSNSDHLPTQIIQSL